MIYTMDIETSEGVKQHPYHLGTERILAEAFVCEALRRPGVMTVALRLDGELVKIFDQRDLAEPEA